MHKYLNFQNELNTKHGKRETKKALNIIKTKLLKSKKEFKADVLWGILTGDSFLLFNILDHLVKKNILLETSGNVTKGQNRTFKRGKEY